jgi:hypothetical protein
MAKRDGSKSRKLPVVDTATHDAETVRLVREAVKKSASGGWYIHKYHILDILNRKPAAKKARTWAGGK